MTWRPDWQWLLLLGIWAIVVLLYKIHERLKAICLRLDALTDDDVSGASRDLLKAIDRGERERRSGNESMVD